LDDVAKVFRVPPFEVNRIKDFLIERSSGDMRASSTIEDTIEQFPQAKEVASKYPDLAKANWLEGNLKGSASTLPARPLKRADHERHGHRRARGPEGLRQLHQVVAMDKKDAERQGMVKMDFLGLNTMSMIWDSLKWLGRRTSKWLYSLPLDDPKVYRLLQEIDVTGVFQFEGRVTALRLRPDPPEKFSDIMDCGALCRPGPLHNGAARVRRDPGRAEAGREAKHPALETCSGRPTSRSSTRSRSCNIARVIGGFDAAGVGAIRTIIAKKEGEQAFAARTASEFIKGALTLSQSGRLPADFTERRGLRLRGHGDVGRLRLQRRPLRRVWADQLLHRVPEGVPPGSLLRGGSQAVDQGQGSDAAASARRREACRLVQAAGR
jgi:hypothetical protein